MAADKCFILSFTMKKKAHFIIILFCLLSLPLFFGLKFLSNHRRYTKNLIVTIASAEIDEVTPFSFVFLLYPDTDLKSCEQNILSISQQEYQHYRVILITSENMTPKAEEITKFAAKHNKDHLFSVFCSQREEPLLSTYKRAVSSCSNNEIIIEMNMNDWLANNNVLSLLNQIYHSSKDVWLTFGDHLNFPSYLSNKSFSQNRKKKSEPLSWIDSSFKTYYVGLFTQIHTSNKFTHNSSPFKKKRDLFVLPMVNQAKNHIHYIDEILFIHKSSELN